MSADNSVDNSVFDPAFDPPSPPGLQIDIRCWKCKKLLAELLTDPWKIRCPRCHEPNQSPRRDQA